jgi:cellulose synthase/poly-beta-1,6-N-acetylglucosamine synthase-like glycosyltransferase
MNVLDGLMLVALICIWLLLLVNVVLIVAGYRYYLKCESQKPPVPKTFPMVSIMVPAHNEGKVIVQTVRALLSFTYPRDRYEVIVINDNSSDNSAELLVALKEEMDAENLVIINTDKVTGGKGKSNALNIGFQKCRGEYIVIYDADNTPEKGALGMLVGAITSDDSLGAVIGKFRDGIPSATSSGWVRR